jgi:hypothetical protein
MAEDSNLSAVQARSNKDLANILRAEGEFSFKNIFGLMFTGCLRENRMRRSFFSDEPGSKRCLSVPEGPAGLQSGQPLFQSVNSLETAVTGRSPDRYNALDRDSKGAKATGLLTPVGCHTWRQLAS